MQAGGQEFDPPQLHKFDFETRMKGERMGILLLLLILIISIFLVRSKEVNPVVKIIAKGILVVGGIFLAIIVVLMLMIAIPNFNKARNDARQSNTLK